MQTNKKKTHRNRPRAEKKQNKETKINNLGNKKTKGNRKHLDNNPKTISKTDLIALLKKSIP